MKHLKKFNEGDKYKRGTKHPKDPNEITAEDIINDFMNKTGLSKEESLKLLDEFSEKMDKLKNKNGGNSYTDEMRDKDFDYPKEGWKDDRDWDSAADSMSPEDYMKYVDRKFKK